MDKRTRLITIEYDEYIELKKLRDNTETEKINELIKELNNLILIVNRTGYSTFDKKDIEGMIKSIINACDVRLQNLKKESESNENRR